MSQDVARSALALEMTDRPGHIEYSHHHALFSEVTGLPQEHAELAPRFYDAWQMDLAWYAYDGAAWPERGRATNMGHAVFLADGSDRRAPDICPFKSVDDVYAFDAVEEYGLPDADALVADLTARWQARQAQFPNALIPGGYYKTLVSGAILAFGWDMLLLAAADQQRFERVLDSIVEVSLHYYRAWARTPIDVFISHDDMVWSQGAFIHPDFYSRVIFPRYKKLWSVLKDAGKKVLYCCDGDWSQFMPEVAAAGADGFLFEPMVPFERAVSDFGKTHVLVGSHVDCRTLTFGSQDQIRAEIDASLALGRDCPGWFFAVGNHIAPNVPVENARFYFDYLASHWQR